jgi:hypothetical protein
VYDLIAILNLVPGSELRFGGMRNGEKGSKKRLLLGVARGHQIPSYESPMIQKPKLMYKNVQVKA